MQGKNTDRLKTYTFKLNSLLAITQAINENLSKDELLSRYESILKNDLNIGKILVFINSERWEQVLTSGFPDDYKHSILVEQDLLCFSEITFVTTLQNELLAPFDIIMPVYNNNKPLAFILIGDIEEEGEGISPTIKHLHFIQTLSSIIIVAIENIRLFQESIRQIAMKKELELASKMQNMLIPSNDTLPKNDKLHVTAFYHPHLDVGGDYYDVIPLSNKEIGFCIADVSGKGISAAILMSNFQANLRALFTAGVTLESLVEKLNLSVINNAKGEKFITLFIGKYNYFSRELEYINAAHNAPIYYDAEDKKIVYLSEGCVGMGMLDDIPFIKRGSIQIKKNSKILCFTDGLVEMMDDYLVDNANDIIEKHISNEQSVKENIDAIIEYQKILSGNEKIFDDITMLGVQFF